MEVLDQRVPCIEGTTDMSCDNCHICRYTAATAVTDASATTPSVNGTPNHRFVQPTSGAGSTLTLRRICTLLLVISFIATAAGCGPGRGIGGPRRKRKLTPLVFKQHVPNMSEQTLGASGVSEGAIERESAKFKKLEFNNNRDIIFKDEEGTGADHVMSRVSPFKKFFLN